MVTMKISSQGSAGIAFIGDQTSWTQSGLPGTSVNGTAFHQFFCLVDVTFLTRREEECDQSAGTFTTNVDFGAKTTTTTPRPSASRSGLLFLHQQHVGGLARSWSQ